MENLLSYVNFAFVAFGVFVSGAAIIAAADFLGANKLATDYGTKTRNRFLIGAFLVVAPLSFLAEDILGGNALMWIGALAIPLVVHITDLEKEFQSQKQDHAPQEESPVRPSDKSPFDVPPQDSE